jgi:hypothetical protein
VFGHSLTPCVKVIESESHVECGWSWPTDCYFQTPLPYYLWWLILCVCMTGLRDIQIAWKTLFLCISVRVFLKEISTSISVLCEKIALMNVGRCLLIHREPQIKWKGRGRINLLFVWARPYSNSCPWTWVDLVFELLYLKICIIGSLVLRPSDLGWNYIISFSGPPSCRWQIVRIHSLHNCVSKPSQ